MIRLPKSQIFKQFHSDVWLLLGFTYLNRLGFFISIPYLAFYLTYLKYTPLAIGIIVAAQALSYSLSSVFCGHLSDRFGKKPAMVSAMFLSTLASLGLAHSFSALGYIFFNLLIGLSRSLFDAAMPAYLTDITPAESHRLLFNLRFLTINIAGATGPLIGVYFASHHSHMIFNLSAIIYCICAIFVQWQLPKHGPNRHMELRSENSLQKTFSTMLSDKILLLVVIATMLYWFIYIQLEAPFAQVLQHRNPETATLLFGLMWIINTGLIVVLQLLLASWTKNTSLIKLIYTGGVLFIFAFAGLAFFTSSFAFVTCIIFITLGEMLYSPLCNILIADIAPAEMRGAYFGAISFSSLGTAIGPIVGGLLIQYSTSKILFLTMAIISGFIIDCYRRSVKAANRQLAKNLGEVEYNN